MAKFILRVDDCGWVPPDKTDDRGLDYFRAWREAAGLEGLPVYYGFIPTTVGLREIDWLRDNLKGDEQIAVHGYDHARGAVLTEEQFGRGWRLLGMAQGWHNAAYIPPFNAYDREAVYRWGRVTSVAGFTEHRARSFFFGGFRDDPQSVDFGEYPTIVDRYATHLPATRELYDHAPQLLARLPQAIASTGDCPRVVTLHCTWDQYCFSAVREVVDLLRPHLVKADAALDWIERLSGGRR